MADMLHALFRTLLGSTNVREGDAPMCGFARTRSLPETESTRRARCVRCLERRAAGTFGSLVRRWLRRSLFWGCVRAVSCVEAAGGAASRGSLGSHLESSASLFIASVDKRAGFRRVKNQRRDSRCKSDSLSIRVIFATFPACDWSIFFNSENLGPSIVVIGPGVAVAIWGSVRRSKKAKSEADSPVFTNPRRESRARSRKRKSQQLFSPLVPRLGRFLSSPATPRLSSARP